MKQKQQEEHSLRDGSAGFRMRSVSLGLALALMLIGPALADDIKTVDVTIKDHRFSPSEIHVQAGQPVILNLKNEDATAEEFDSSALKVEKVIVGGAVAKVRLRPLGPGRYAFEGEYHSDTAQGAVIAE